MKDKKKVVALGKVCYTCSVMIMSNEDYTTLVHKQKGSETMALAHTDWTGCQKAINRPMEKLEYRLQVSRKRADEQLLTAGEGN